MLLINDGEPQILEWLLLRYERMRADQDLELALSQAGRQALPIGLLGVAGK